MKNFNPATLCAAWLALILAFIVTIPPATAQTTAPGTITGNVGNAATGNLLEGARVEIPQLGRSVLTSNTGRYVFSGIPAGTHEVVASYTGLDPMRDTITVNAGQSVSRNFDLTTGIYKLQAFNVSGVREGSAAAITLQRNAPNVTNIVALDSYGNLPNMNASELAVLLPGVAGNLSDEGNIVGFTIRGMGPGMNTITVDGALMASQGGMNRQTRIHTITGSMFDQLELTKGHTPDKGADSLGGTVNLKTRSPLSMREKRRTTYNFSARLAPAFTQQIPMREDHRLHPLLNVAHQEKFNAFGSTEPNLGVAVNLFYSEQAVGFFSTTRDFQNTLNEPAYLWDYRTQDNYNNRKQSSVNAKFDYQLSPNTKVTLNLIYNDAFERFRLRYSFRAFTQNTNAVPNATTSGVIPGFSDRITQVRPVNASTIDITSQMSNFFHRQRHVDLGAEHTFGAFDIDYNAVYSRDHINGGGGDGGVLVNRVNRVGWILDRTASDLYPTFTQTAGPDISDPASYSPNSLTFADTFTKHEIREIRGNVRYKLPVEMPLSLKTGFRIREETAGGTRDNHRYNFTGTNSGQLPTDPTIQTFGNLKTGLDIPAWNANAISRRRMPIDLSLWNEDIYYNLSQAYIGTNEVVETVTAGYLMAQGSIGRTGFLAGVRTERTEDESYGWVRNRVGSTAAEQRADPVGSAESDYANTRRNLSGSYTKSFPSVHLTHDITSNLKARLSWSTSFGRPPLGNLTPSEGVNENNETLTISNPSLLPQTAENWDASLDYYFEPVGNLSVGWFHKTIEDYFVNNIEAGIIGPGQNNGYNGDYSGFTILTRGNLGTATVQGWELSYQQQFTFLPGLLSGLGLSANTTILETRGDFGGSEIRRTGEVPGFIPRTSNINLTWRYRGFGARIVANRTGEYIRSFDAGSPARNLYTRERTIVNAGIAYQWKPRLSFSIDVNNLFNEPQVWYRGLADRMSETRIAGITLTFGVSGRF